MASDQLATGHIDGQGEDVGAGHHDLPHPQFPEAQEVLDEIPLHLRDDAPAVAVFHHADKIFLLHRGHLGSSGRKPRVARDPRLIWMNTTRSGVNTRITGCTRGASQAARRPG